MASNTTSKVSISSTTATLPKPSITTSITETIIRFVVLYLTTLLSLDTVTAARQSPFSIVNPQIPDSMRRTGRSGEAYRLDPGGNGGPKRGGFDRGTGQHINVPVCKSCPANGIPQIS